ncbi:MAG: (2Fe-2S)-binding protein [Defluviitaleaceae bacterium]|nr:(2Fe-2S)-binding protein [Defluviitaleaceae bacterium]
MSGDSIVCRCSDLDINEIRGYIDQGYTTVEEIKRLARLGMGPCQGRNCIPIVMRELSIATGKPISEIAAAVSRPPAKAIKLGEIVRAFEEETGGAK